MEEENNVTVEEEAPAENTVAQEAPVQEEPEAEPAVQAAVISRKKEAKHSAFSQKLNNYFHHIDRGGTLKGEIVAGLIAFFLSVCVIIMNVQVIANTLGIDVQVENSPLGATNIANSDLIVAYYMGSIIIAFVGSLLVGLIARLPFVQVSLMGLSSSMICLAGSSSGLTYYNILFVSLIASVIYAVLVSVPVVKKYVFEAIPKPIRKILPAAVGLITISIASQASGIFDTTTLAIGSSSATISYFSGISDSASTVTVVAFVCGIIAGVVYLICAGLKLKHKVMYSFLSGTLIFIICLLCMGGFDTANSDSYINFGRVWVIAGSQASESTPFADSYLTYLGEGFSTLFANFGKVFTEGTQFAEGVNAAKFIIFGTLVYLFIGMYDCEATLQATQSSINRSANDAGRVNFDDQKGCERVFIINAAVNVAAPFFGVGAVSYSRSSIASTEDNGKSGIVSVTAAIGYLISLFILAFPALLATNTYVVNSMNEFNYYAYGNGGFIVLFSSLSYGIADAVMVVLGISMLKAFRDIDYSNVGDAAAAVVTVAASFLFTNLALGVACGVITYIVCKVLSFNDENLGFIESCKHNFIPQAKSIGIPTYALGALSVVMLATI